MTLSMNATFRDRSKGLRSTSICLVFAALWLAAPIDALPSDVQGGPSFVTIGSGAITGLYYPTGLIIAKLVNDKRDVYNIRAAVESTPGSVFNVYAIVAGYLEFGLVQSDKQYQAVKGMADWTPKGPQEDLRAVASIHRESICLIAAADAGIETVADLKGKRVNLGNPRSGHQNAIDALKSAGLDPDRDIVAEKVSVSEAVQLLQDNKIDAFFYTVGHPSEVLEEATSGARKVRFVPITGPGVEKLIAEQHYYTKTVIPVTDYYRGSANTGDVETFGVLATLCTHARVPDHVVYAITKELFENLGYIRQQHPAFVGLTREGMLEGLTAPLHPGAILYFRESGMIK